MSTSEQLEFKSFGKIGRESPFYGTITEKINGTNACIVIDNGEIVGVQSRKNFITPDKDNFGFAKWVQDNNDDLLKLGDGHHFGEWAGEGIQKNELKLEGKQFFLFNTFRDQWPECCKRVPVLYIGDISNEVIAYQLDRLENANDGKIHKGVVVYYHALRGFSKHTIKTPRGKLEGKK